MLKKKKKKTYQPKNMSLKMAGVVNVLKQQTPAHSAHIHRDPQAVIYQVD